MFVASVVAALIGPGAVAAPPGTDRSVATPGADASAERLDRIVVESTGLERAPAFEVPASVTVVDLRAGNDDANASVSEALDGIPGVLARERQNYAQDTQLSIRGFGARSTFGVRGLRLYADGIPATMPDGQGQISHVSLLDADRIEVMRGPFSALYGNSSGGVVRIIGVDGLDGTDMRAQATFGRDDGRTVGARLRGGGEFVDYAVLAQRFATDGYRDHGAARRTLGNARLQVAIGDAATLRLVANAFDAPDAQDPLGLTRAQLQADPRQAAPAATQFDTRKSVDQTQLGLVYEHAVSADQTLRAMAYAGRRGVEQFLALPVAAQANPLNSGGVIDLAGRYGGTDWRWSWHTELARRPLELSVGLAADRQRQARSGYENFVGDRLGVRGGLRRDERNEVGNVDRYAQAFWQFADRWSLLAGARHSAVRFESRDRYVTAANPDDSGRVDYRETTPVAGLMFSPTQDLRWYVSAGRGFETPTFNEIAYRADGGAGLAFDLRPAVSRTVEVGAKWRSDNGATVNAALFRADTDDELAVARNVGGRSSFRNVGAARRAGIEAALRVPLGEAWHLGAAYTRTDATFRDGFALCSGAGCTTPETVVAAGTRIPGVARDQMSAHVQWEARDWTAVLELEAVGDVTVNDTGSERAAGYALLHLELARQWRVGDGTLRGFVRVDNALDRGHIGSVIVNEGNGRFFEPALGRGVLVGARWDWSAR
ncbi:TonB-dependent receptor domain-containing protein [Chiayiivirga flava]|uniref:TonB-dependent receptor family protein n=1 Tax=Chiayiivirga flava TaxID=659595 RepID=UPI0016193FD7|nr:TonB-dependent receptor [Chiayiivirga flava]